MKRYFSPQSLIAILSVAITIFVLIQNARAEDQGNMHNALRSLQEARTALNHARGSKDGHRAEALKLVYKAIGEVKAGIAAGEENE